MLTRARRRSKPVEALQYDGSQEGCHALVGFTRRVVLPCRPDHVVFSGPRGLQTIASGDWLVRDVGTGEVTLVPKEQFFADYDHAGLKVVA